MNHISHIEGFRLSDDPEKSLANNTKLITSHLVQLPLSYVIESFPDLEDPCTH